MRIHVWGHSGAKSVKLNGQTLPERDSITCNEWIDYNLNPVLEPTDTFVLELAKGALDPWFRKYNVGVRRIELFGFDSSIRLNGLFQI